MTGLLLGGTVAVLVWAILDLHASDAAAARRICAAERTDRAVDQVIVTAAGLHVTVPPLTRKECP